MTRWNRYGVSFAVMAALLLALPVLAVLQYRWVGQVSQAELERLHGRLRVETGRFAEEFNNILRDTFIALQTPRLGDDFDGRRFIRDVFIARVREGGELDLFHAGPDHGRAERVDWPPHLAHLRDRLRPGSRPEFGPPGGSLADEPAVLVAPHIRQPGPGRPRFGGPPEWVIAELDIAAIQSQLIPELVQRRFSGADGLDYDVLILSRGGRNRVIYRSDPKLPPEAFAHPDAAAPLFNMRPDMNPSPPGAGRWQALFRRRSGSLEAAVEHARRRDLAISFAVLSVLAAGIVMLLFTTRRAQRLAELQMDFIAGVSHELRTPLSVICSAADNLADGLVANPAQVKRYGSLIRGEGHRLSEMVDQILRFAGIQSGRARYELKPEAVSTIIDRALAMCRTPLLESGCEVEKRIDPDLPLVMADATSLAHCVGNLVGNAAKYARAGGWIGLRARLADSGDEIRISVEDRGPGIEADDLPHLFEPFYRGSLAISDQIHGAGLGLSLVKRIVEAHQGTVEVASRRESGACFTLRIKTAHGTTNSAG